MDKHRDPKWNEETQSGTYPDKIHWGELKRKSMITVLNEKAIAVEVPAYPEHFKPYVGNIRNSLMYRENTDLKETELLPSGSWSILGRPNEMAEEQWKGIVEGWAFGTGRLMKAQPNTFKDYLGESTLFHTATESGLSLLKSKSLEGKSIIILTKNPPK